VTLRREQTDKVPNSIRPGDVLADRYLLVDLLSESGNGRFWRALDQTLERHVAVHVVAGDDDHAAAMMAAARSSATVHDRRILRVLDVDERDGLCYVVNEWGSGTSLDRLVSAEGPLGARRAAWIVSEVAHALAAAHDAGVAHGRLVPENVLIDESGVIRLIGFSVDAALLGLPPGRVSSDVGDLAGLLYFLLTGKWAGVSRSAVPSAPLEAGRVLRPRQVKAGVPRDLDSLCDQVVNGPETATRLTARDIHETLVHFVGDPAGLAAAEALGRNGVHRHQTRAMPRPAVPPPVAPEMGEEPEAAVPHEPVTEVMAVPGDLATDPAPEPAADHAPDPIGEPAPAAASTEQPTQAGMPIFDDESEDVAWFNARAEKPAPPPPFEEPPERPLFAPDPEDGQPVRRPRPSAARPAGTGDYWPWDTGAVGHSSTGSGVIPVTEDDDEEDDGVPGRSWLRLAMIVGLCALLLVAIVFAFNLGRGRSPLGELPGDEESSSSPASRTTAEAIEVASAADFDPQGDPPEENPELAPLVVDGDPATAWRTMTYNDQLGPGGLKTGVGLVLDLGEAQEVSQVDLTLVGAPTGVSLYVEDSLPTGVRDLTPVTSTEAKARQRLTLDEPVTGRYVVVWLTALPAIEGGYRGEVAEVVVRG
jgi:hypothetical protein